MYTDRGEPAAGDLNAEGQAKVWPPQRPPTFCAGGGGLRRSRGPLGLSLCTADRVQQPALSGTDHASGFSEQPAASFGRE